MLVLALGFAGLVALPTSRAAAAPATFHVTLGASNADMSLMGMAFYPNALTVHQGDVIVFTNYLIEPHTVTFGLTGPVTNPFAFFAPQNLSGPGTATFNDSGIVSSGILVPQGPFGNSIAVTIDVGPGTYAVQCALHPLMSGKITVVPDSQKLPKTDAQYQKQAHARMMVDIAHARRIEKASIKAAFTAADIGGKGIEVAIGGGNGVSTVMRFFSPQFGDEGNHGIHWGSHHDRDSEWNLSNLVIHVGDTVHFVNRDPFTPHTVTFGLEPPGGDQGLVAPANRSFPFSSATEYNGSFNLNSGFLLSNFPWGNMFNVTFTAVGTYHYICGLHDMMGMQGTITVEA